MYLKNTKIWGEVRGRRRTTRKSEKLAGGERELSTENKFLSLGNIP